MTLRDGSDETRAVVQELLSSLGASSDLVSALHCLREVLRSVVSVEDLVLFVRTSESQHVTCISKDGTFQVSDFSVEFPQEPSVVPTDHAIESLPCSLGISKAQNDLLAHSHLGFSAEGYHLFPLQGMTESFVAMGILFSGRQPEAASIVFFQQLARSIGVAIDNVILRERIGRLQGAFRKTLGHLGGLRDVSLACISRPSLQDLIDGISANVRERFGTEILCLLRHRPEAEDMLWAAMHFPNGQGPRVVGTTTSIRETRNGGTVAIKTRQAVLANRNMLNQTASENCISTLLTLKAKTYYAVPLVYCGQVIGVLAPAHVRRNAFSSEEIALWDDCASQVSLALKCFSAQDASSFSSEAREYVTESSYEVHRRDEFSELIGDSPALKRVLSQVEMVAPLDSSVLLLGETGTGKGMLAKAIHRLSRRKTMPFVVINCAAIPASLLESEMFGHERGAFTGAFSRRTGRLEQANGGTVFFDEIGKLPLELQPKLLRVIQEQQIERLGGNASVQLDVRFICATNRELEQMVKDKQFRSDLYYRVSVFPIAVPSLAERPDDIEALSHYFLEECNRRMNKNIERIPRDIMERLQDREWGGNVRELRNVIERAAIMTSGPSLEFPTEGRGLPLTRSACAIPAKFEFGEKTWEEVERDYILRALRNANGVIAEAARHLRLKRTTLDSRLRRLGITQMELEVMPSGPDSVSIQ